ncbi:MAG: hypothetical protein M9949_02140 [Candidatus Kapabacteria bacterium]|nr:hypothetical protein [Candidatus Kapabacteria bacterium]
MKNFCIIILVFSLNVSLGYAQFIVNAQTETEIYVTVAPVANTAISLAFRNLDSPKIMMTYDSTNHVALTKVMPADFGKIAYSSAKFHDIAIENLKPATEYVVDYIVYDKKSNKITKIDSIIINTFDTEPVQPARAIAFKNKSYNNVGLLWIAGNGSNVLVTVSENAPGATPTDGAEYFADATFGNPQSLIPGTNTYVLYSGPNTGKLDIQVTGLKYAEYHFRIFDYNGEGKFTNYLINTSQNNPRSTFTLIPPPKNLRALIGTDGESVLHWDGVDGAESYVIDIALDESFIQKVEPYAEANIGSISEIPIVVSDEKGPLRLFCRIKAVGKASVSPYSKVLVVEMKQ